MILKRIKNLWKLSEIGPFDNLEASSNIKYMVHKSQNVGFSTSPKAIIIKKNQKDPVKEIINENNENTDFI